MLYFLFLLFWLGLFMALATEKTKIGLKERAALYYQNVKQKTAGSKLGKYFAGKKLQINKSKYDRELLDSLIYTKNMVSIGDGEYASAVNLFEELAGISKLLAPCFHKMAFYMQTYNVEDAAGCLYSLFQTDYAKDIGNFLAGWEEIDPAKLRGMLDAYIETMRSKRTAALKQRDEIVSDLIYFPVVINCMAVLLNFVYIAFYMQQQDMFQLFF